MAPPGDDRRGCHCRCRDRQIAGNDNAFGFLAQIALSEPKHADPVIDLRNEQQVLRVAIASLREQLDGHPELPIDTSSIRERFTELAHRYRRHPTRETELIHTALGIDITQPIDQQPR